MGLCKCPKKVVTPLFCYEHRVNVCEYCMAMHHSNCIVQTYREWLRDADYDPSCKLCSRALSNEDCLRLPCFHLFHWSCLSEHCASLPDTTAPAGYQCPQCSQPIFPSANAGSLTSNLCMERLASVNWGRRGLGLPMFTENESSLPSSNDVSAPSGFSKDRFFPSQQTHQFTYDETTHLTRVPEVQAPRRIHGVSMEESRSLLEGRDMDENKYARRSIRQGNCRPQNFARGICGRPSRMQLIFYSLVIIAFTGLVISVSMFFLPED
ncbi:Hypothetical protein NTJ_03129 [Nesidiocoris tenuis]|uniref:Zinc finger protein-like 1 homolog n=1 Tax=Nesidiocoris tenuis TaxID=355587 RepID=A0ABN7ADG1_9HEMI|nr:Hypothetical protein NTJ_03129 [Nesidiocoris tenuis]